MPKKKKADPLDENDEIENLVEEIKKSKESAIDDEDELYEDFGSEDEDDGEVMVKHEEHHMHQEEGQSPDEEE